MATNAGLRIDGEQVVQALQEIREKLDSGKGELMLDFSSVPRIDASALKAMNEFAGAADGKGVKVVLRGVNVNIYKVLKLVRLTSRFSFLN